MKIGTLVRNKETIQSDDRENGINDGTKIIPPNTTGVVLGLSKDFLEKGNCLKSGCEDCLVVSFQISNETFKFDVQPEEILQINEPVV